MSATTLEPGMIDISQSKRPSMAKLVTVEVRKMTDTRAGLWLLLAIALITLVVNAAFLIWGDNQDLTFLAFLQFSAMPQGMLLPVLAVLLVTQEWGQRTGLVSFALVPNRGRVIFAKLAAATLFVIAAYLVALVIALVLTPIAGADGAWDDVTAPYLLRIGLALLIGAFWGFGFGLALLNTAFAIVAYFAVPTVVSIVSAIWPDLMDKMSWIDLSLSSSRLFESTNLSGEEWAQIGTGMLIWIVLPMVIGWIRVQKAEIK